MLLLLLLLLDRDVVVVTSCNLLLLLLTDDKEHEHVTLYGLSTEVKASQLENCPLGSILLHAICSYAAGQYVVTTPAVPLQ